MATPETTVRSRALAAGFRVYKSRERSQHSNNHGLYQLVDPTNTVVLGVNYDAELSEIDNYIADLPGRMTGNSLVTVKVAYPNGEREAYPTLRKYAGELVRRLEAAWPGAVVSIAP